MQRPFDEMLSSLERLLLHTRSRSQAAAAAAAASAPVRTFIGLRHLSRATVHPHHLSWEGRGGAVPTTAAASSRAKDLVSRIELALKARRVDEAWVAFDALRASGGAGAGAGLLPPQALIGGLITASSYSSDTGRLRRACELAVALSRKRADLLHYDALARLALALARAQMPEPAATVLRVMLERGKLPPAPVWSSAFSHLVKTPVGSHLASGILIELCECFTQCPLDSKRSKLTKPGTTLFNLVLDACLRHGSPLEAQQLIDLMPRTGVVADANTIVAVARVYEMNGHREDLKRLKLHVDSVPSSALLDRHYQQFYGCLLSLHFKFDDIAAAAELVLDLYRRRPKLRTQQSVLGKPSLVQVGSGNLKSGCKMLIEPTLLGCDLVAEPECHFGLIMFTDRGLRPSNTAIAKLIYGFVRLKRVGELSKLLESIHEAVQVSAEDNLISEVILACVGLGWLETAHDILDDMESAGAAVPEATYASLLTAYSKQNLLSEAKVLLRQMRKGGMLENLPDEEAISLCLSEELLPAHNLTDPVSGSCLAKFLDEEAREDDGSRDHLTYEFNSSIFFFCKAKMMEDAVRTFRRMHERRVQPTVQTFSHLTNGYSSLEAYREIAILWGEIKRRLDGGALLADRDLFECLLWNFIRGGYFERAMEIVSCMAEHDMYVDKWKFRREFLRLHENLYRNLNKTDARTDAQSKRLEHVKSFRKWVGIDKVRGMN
ncbi:hypothetical protein Taro_004210 [Colocasia esculenta]|uniref:At1g68980-like TPR repeats domain-containing protein n=1 Tax=Colocasia esculenta TaxID=4460 RepID=A0A843TR27_COLES|nr:hypothetical protein [Colocasia esculenta]